MVLDDIGDDDELCIRQLDVSPFGSSRHESIATAADMAWTAVSKQCHGKIVRVSSVNRMPEEAEHSSDPNARQSDRAEIVPLASNFAVFAVAMVAGQRPAQIL